MFENPRRGRQARNFTTNVPKILDLNRLPNRYFWKIDIGCPWLPALYPSKMFCHFWMDLVSIWMARGIRSKKFSSVWTACAIRSKKKCHPFERLGLSVCKKLSSPQMAWDIRFKKLLSVRMARAIHSKKKLSTVGGTEPICSKINFSRVSIPKPFHL